MPRDENEPKGVLGLRVEIVASIFALGLAGILAGLWGVDIGKTHRDHVGGVLFLIAGSGFVLYGLFASWWIWHSFYRRSRSK